MNKQQNCENPCLKAEYPGIQCWNNQDQTQDSENAYETVYSNK